MPQKPQAKTLAQFRETFDPDVKIPAKIKAALASLLAEGAEAWEYEKEFLVRSGISTTQLGQYREQFTKHIVVVREDRHGGVRNIWFADPKVADKVR